MFGRSRVKSTPPSMAVYVSLFCHFVLITNSDRRFSFWHKEFHKGHKNGQHFVPRVSDQRHFRSLWYKFWRMRAVLLLAFVLLGVVRAESQSIKLQPCEVAGTAPNAKLQVLCGSLEVFEDRKKAAGRKIGLAIQVYPATGVKKDPDPVFYIPGGPGSSAIEDAPYIAEDLKKIRETRDLVFVDQRGTGSSNGLVCELFDPGDVASYLGHWNPPERVRECRKRLESKADLRLYVTTLAMDDLDDVRAALGYDKINLFGGSYGTRAVQVYIKRHPDRVRSAVLHGVSPTDQWMPAEFPRQTETALQGLIDECLADAACKAAFPNVREEARAVLAALKKGPVEAEITPPPDRKPVKVKLSRDLAGEAVRYMLYQSGSAGRIPLYLHLASQGDYAPLATAALMFRRRIVSTGATGLYLSITCAEDVPFVRDDAARGKLDDTFLGDYRYRQMREACNEWPRGEMDKDYFKPVRTNAPVLITTGNLDPVTPPLYGDRVAKGMPNSFHVVVPSGGHGFSGLKGRDCITNLIVEFIRSATVKGLDTSCVKSIRREGFLLKL